MPGQWAACSDKEKGLMMAFIDKHIKDEEEARKNAKRGRNLK